MAVWHFFLPLKIFTFAIVFLKNILSSPFRISEFLLYRANARQFLRVRIVSCLPLPWRLYPYTFPSLPLRIFTYVSFVPAFLHLFLPSSLRSFLSSFLPSLAFPNTSHHTFPYIHVCILFSFLSFLSPFLPCFLSYSLPFLSNTSLPAVQSTY